MPDPLHTRIKNLIKHSWTDLQKLERFMGGSPDPASAKESVLALQSEEVAGKLRLDKRQAEEFHGRYYQEEIEGKKLPPLDEKDRSGYTRFKGEIDRLAGAQVFSMLAGQPCGAISNIMSQMFYGDSLSGWRDSTAPPVGLAHIDNTREIDGVIRLAKDRPVAVFARIEARDFGHSYTYVGEAGKKGRILGVIYQSNFHQSLWDSGAFDLNRWVSSPKFDREVDLEEHLEFLSSFKNKSLGEVMRFVEEHYLIGPAPETTRESVKAAMGKSGRPDIWVVINPIVRVRLENNVREFEACLRG
ncbi:MAG TPA: hypothetical protein VIL46_03940 [Gemmataceae bacterium]